MQDYIYSIISLLAIVIHLIINFDTIFLRGEMEERVRRYKAFLASVFIYYITDAAWGLLAGLKWTVALYADTVLYFIALAITTLMWCRAAVAYLDFGKWTSRILSWFGYAIVAFYVGVMVVNAFNNCFFYFSEQGDFVIGEMRYPIFLVLIAFDALMTLFVLGKALDSHDSVRRRNIMVFVFSVAMTAAMAVQVFWPLLPFTALGFLVGSCFLHTFVVEEERAKLRQAIIEHKEAKKHLAELESALERARAAEKARSMFFSIVSHDIRTPLNAILGYSELLQYGVKIKSDMDEALKSIRSSGTTLLQLVNDVLDLAKMDSGKMTIQTTPVNLSQLTDEVFATFKMAAEAKGLAMINKTSNVPTIRLDDHRFRQILFNLVGNAVKFTSQGSVTVSASYTGNNLEVSVTDTGCGIAPDMLTRILDPFVQVLDPSHSADRAQGTGLGLSICRSLVETMGGELTIKSELGKGSTFTAHIPGIALSEDAAAPQIAAAVQDTTHLTNMPRHVLVVDDSPVNRAVLKAFLKKADIKEIDCAGDGQEALSMLESDMTAGNPHDFVLSDLWMPNMNGTELIEKIRANPRFCRLPVYAVTADTEFERDNRNSLFTGILLKPLTYAKLIEVLTAPGPKTQAGRQN